MEWDTASGYAILENAGGKTLDFRLKKNKLWKKRLFKYTIYFLQRKILI